MLVVGQGKRAVMRRLGQWPEARAVLRQTRHQLGQRFVLCRVHDEPPAFVVPGRRRGLTAAGPLSKPREVLSRQRGAFWTPLEPFWTPFWTPLSRTRLVAASSNR